MEAVKVKKPKPKERSRPPDVPPEPAARSRDAFPVVPRHQPGDAVPAALADPVAAPRNHSPEPEEVTLSDHEEPAEKAAMEPARPAPPPPVVPRHMIFPKTTGERAACEGAEAKAREAEREVSAPAVAPAAPVYPHMPQPTLLPDYSHIGMTRPAASPPSYAQLREQLQPAAPPVVMPSVPLDTKHMYPAIRASMYERTRHGLLSTQQLLTFYNNPLLNTSGEFVDRFVKEEQHPQGPLFDLLHRLKEVNAHIVISEVKERENAAALQKCLHDCWTVENKSVPASGQCGEGRPALGTGRYTTAHLNMEALERMKRLLQENREVLLNERLSQEVESRSLSLQIQWAVGALCSAFLQQHGVHAASPPCLLEAVEWSMPRTDLKRGLSDCLFHLRFPSLPLRYTQAVTGWITEMAVVMYKWCGVEDALWLFNHLLRLPSPVAEWAAPLVQTFASSASSPKLKVDYCLTMLSHLMRPVKCRDEFLGRIGQSEAEDSSWAILSENEEDESDFSLVTVNETDLVAFLDQLPATDFYSLAYLHFTTSTLDRCEQFLSLVALQLELMRLLRDGLQTYTGNTYKQFAKQIAMTIRQSVRELCAHWRVARGAVTDESQLQREVDRVMLTAVTDITHCGSGLWQFVVDLPFECASEDCRQRVEGILRRGSEGGGGGADIETVYDVPMQSVVEANAKGGLSSRVSCVGVQQAGVYVVRALAALAAHSTAPPTKMMAEVIETCFVDEASRDELYKVGGEALAELIAARPLLLDQLLVLVDRRIDAIGEYALHLFTSVELRACRVSESVLGSVVGKWLVHRPADHPANRVARRVLSSLDWGFDSAGRQHLEMSTHEMCADIVVKAHHVQCQRSNGLIAKSIGKVAKLASKIPDHEQLFTQFCWDCLIKLKLPIKQASSPPQADLAAFFVWAAQHAMNDVSTLLDKGTLYVNELATAGAAWPCVVLVARALSAHHANINQMAGNKEWVECVERVLHLDESSYAMQLLLGAGDGQTRVVRMCQSAIASECEQLRSSERASFLRAWCEVVCVKRASTFAADPPTLQILGTLARLAFLEDSTGWCGLKEQLYNMYMQVLVSWRESSKGLFSMFTADQPPPPLIADADMGVHPWATHLLLIVEETAHAQFYQHVWEALAKKDKCTIESAVKKAQSKCSLALPVERLHCFRWARFVGGEAQGTEVHPLAVQHMATQIFARREAGGLRCFSRRLLSALSPCHEHIEAAKKALEETTEDGGLFRAVLSWLRSDGDVGSAGFDFGRLDLDYLLQMVLADDKNVWLDFVDLVRIKTTVAEELRLYRLACHEERRQAAGPAAKWDGPNIRDRLTRASALPPMPQHPGLTPAPVIPTAFQPHVIHTALQPIIARMDKLSQQFVAQTDSVDASDVAYTELLGRLYIGHLRQLDIQLRCGRCAQPGSTAVQVTISEFNSTTDAQMTQNREARSSHVSDAQSQLLDEAALQCAQLENVAFQIALLARHTPPTGRPALQMCGRTAWQLLTRSVSLSPSVCLFPPAAIAFQHALKTIGSEYIRLRAEEQRDVMRLVLDGFVFSQPLVACFTPECLSPQDLCFTYSTLSQAVQQPEKSQRAMQLMGRLAMDQAAASLPPQQFSALMPMAFQNLASQTDPSTPLHQLCLQHLQLFVFHRFPHNYPAGLELAVNGCNTRVTPVALLTALCERVKEGATGGDMDTTTAQECCGVLARKLAESRNSLPDMFAVWEKYLDVVSLLASNLCDLIVRQTWRPEEATNQQMVFYELKSCFERSVSIWQPLLAPLSPTQPPFTQRDDTVASVVVDRLVSHWQRLPMHASLQPGMNCANLVWQFYCERLSILVKDNAHFMRTLEHHFVRLDWASFWPSLRALQAFDQILGDRSPECAPLVSSIFVRIAWRQLLESKHVPDEIRPSYLCALCSTLARLVSRQTGYAKVRASLVELLKWFSNMTEWDKTPAEEVERMCRVVSECLPHDSKHSPSEPVALFNSVWRKVCCAIPKQPSREEVMRKQAAFVRSEMRLVVRGGAPHALAAYNSVLAETNSLALAHQSLKQFCVVERELTAAWADIGDPRLGEILVSGWCAYVSSNPSSPLLLCSFSTLVASLNPDQLSTALRVFEHTIQAYWKRASASWSELFEWLSFPEHTRTHCTEYLITIPSSENRIPSLPLTLRCFADHGQKDRQWEKRMLEYTTQLKPKYVDNEAAFLCLLRRGLQWMCTGLEKEGAGESVEMYHSVSRWLGKASKDESGFLTSIISSKKTAHSAKLRCVLSIVELYMQHQSVSSLGSPRVSGSQPVTNSRIQALKEAAAHKSAVPFAAAYNAATAYFIQVDSHTAMHTSQLLASLSKALYTEKYL